MYIPYNTVPSSIKIIIIKVIFDRSPHSEKPKFYHWEIIFIKIRWLPFHTCVFPGIDGCGRKHSSRSICTEPRIIVLIYQHFGSSLIISLFTDSSWPWLNIHDNRALIEFLLWVKRVHKMCEFPLTYTRQICPVIKKFTSFFPFKGTFLPIGNRGQIFSWEC